MTKENKQAFLTAAVATSLFLLAIQFANRNDPPRWYGPEDFKGEVVCIDKVTPQMSGFTFNDSIGIGNFYRDWENRLNLGENNYLVYNVSVGDCLSYTHHPMDSVYHISGATGDTTLFVNLLYY